METFEIDNGYGDKFKYNIVFMKNGMRISDYYFSYSNIRHITFNSVMMAFNIYDNNGKLVFNKEVVEKTFNEIIKPAFHKYMENYYSGIDDSAKNKILMDELAQIKQQLSDLFYAPEMTGYTQAKIDFEKNII
jgi:glycyl-tRNA synthetase alpha subunit